MIGQINKQIPPSLAPYHARFRACPGIQFLYVSAICKALNRLTAIQFPADPNQNVTFTYDSASVTTVSHYTEGHGSIAEGAGLLLDLINPLSVPNDILETKDAITSLFGGEE